jgi:predicted enzyme related to lactoylglutathione lyase
LVAPPRDDTLPRALTMNPLVYFEIPVADMKRARLFYERVFAVSLELREIDGNGMALFPHADGAGGRCLDRRER